MKDNIGEEQNNQQIRLCLMNQYQGFCYGLTKIVQVSLYYDEFVYSVHCCVLTHRQPTRIERIYVQMLLMLVAIFNV